MTVNRIHILARRAVGFAAVLMATTAASRVEASATRADAVVAAPDDDDDDDDDDGDVIIIERQPADATGDIPDRVGEEELSDGSNVDVVVYVHSYPQAIVTYPRVWWAGRWYYNVEGNFVFYDPLFGGWSFYWGPPVGLVHVWNHYHPHVTFVWGTGFYGAGYYYGGVSATGWHAHAHAPVFYRKGRPFKQPRAKYRKQPAPRDTAPPKRAAKKDRDDASRTTPDAKRKGEKRTDARQKGNEGAQQRSAKHERKAAPNRRSAPSRAQAKRQPKAGPSVTRRHAPASHPRATPRSSPRGHGRGR